MAIEPPSNYYPLPIDNCSPFNPINYENGYVSNPSVLNPANYLSYPTAQGPELFSSVQISQIQDSLGNYGTQNQVLNGTSSGKVKWTTLGQSTSTYQTDIYRSSKLANKTFNMLCPAGTTKCDIYVIGQGGWASQSGPLFDDLTVQNSGESFGYVYGPGTGSAGSVCILKSIPAQEGLCFKGQFISFSGQYNVSLAQLFAVNGTDNILLAYSSFGNYASNPTHSTDKYTPGNGTPGYARGTGSGVLSNLTGSLLSVKVGDVGIDGKVNNYKYPIQGTNPDPPYSQPASINQAVQFYDEGGKAFGTGGYFTNIYINGSGEGYLHADVNYPNDGAIIIVSYIET